MAGKLTQLNCGYQVRRGNGRENALRWSSLGRLAYRPIRLSGGRHLNFNQAVVNCIKGKLQPIGNAELVKDVMQVILDGLPADEEFFAGLLVAVALGHELNDFFFTIAE